MKNLFKGKVGTAIILLFTFVLAGVAIFTAIRLYQLRSQPVAPNVPSSIPQAQEVNNCTLSFSLTSPTGTPTTTPSSTPTPTPVPQCNSVCTTEAQCPAEMTCNIAAGATTGNCRNVSCTGNSNCICTTATPTPTATPPTGTPNACNGTCGSNANCGNGLVCYQGFCRNQSCTSSTSCTCSGTPAPTPTAASLPDSGSTWPTMLGVGLGILVILSSFLLAL